MSSTSARITLIAGAYKGIGFETARQLGKAGQRILLGARDLARGQEVAAMLKADGIDARPVLIDLEKVATITAAAEMIDAEEAG
jgi:NADP-dependent 3-hydroxy acid dehydrogenase YdfG